MSTTTQTAKRAKFVELAEKRVTNALNAISLIGNLANKGAYEFSKEDVSRIITSLADAVDAVQNRFSAKGQEKPTFKLG